MAQKNARRVMRQTAERALTVLDVALNIAAGSASDTGVPALSSALAALREVVRKIQVRARLVRLFPALMSPC